MRRKARKSPPRPVAALTAAMAAQRLAGAFEHVAISVSLFHGGDSWDPIFIHPARNIVEFELAHGVEAERKAHNDRSAHEALERRRSVVAEHAGFFDLFVPIGNTHSVLVAGPFARARATSSDLRTRWRRLSGRNARPSDPEFVRYARTTLDSPILDATRLRAFQRLLECMAAIFAADTNLDALLDQGRELRGELGSVRAVERTWSAVRSMLDEGAWRQWLGSYRRHELALLGVHHLPEHAIVGLFANRSRAIDPIDELLGRDALQRACCEFAQPRGGLLCGRVRDHGVVLLLDDPSAGARVERKLDDLGDRLAAVARRHGFRMHLGISSGGALLLPARYEAALTAAERALAQGVSSLPASAAPSSSVSPLGDLRRQLARAVGESPHVIGPRFELYLEAAAIHTSYDVDATRAHLEAALDQVMDALSAAGALDDRSAAELLAALGRGSSDAATVGELSTVYREAIARIGLALQQPIAARRERGLDRALGYIRDHLADPLDLAHVSRVAGFAPGYFSKLFARSERTTFREHVQRLRIDRAKQMLAATTLSTERVGQLCGFRTRHRFFSTFKSLEGVTPGEYRARPS